MAASTPPLAGTLAGYRLLRRISSGERADVYLAVAESPEAGEHVLGARTSAQPADDVASVTVADARAPARSLVAVRVYPPSASSDSVALEIEAMSTDATGTLAGLYDVAALEDGRCCLAVERLAGPTVSHLLTQRSLTAGEAVTILAPVVVTIADLAARGFVHSRLAATDILLDDAGRPRIIGLGALRRLPGHAHASEHTSLLRTSHIALAELLEDVAAAVRPAGVFDDAIDLVRGRLDARPFRSCEAELERRLFAAAAPEPIAGIDVRRPAARLPTRIGAPIPWPQPHDGTGLENREDRARQRARGFRAFLGLAQLPDELGDRVANALDAVPGSSMRNRLGSAIRERSRALSVGGLIGGGALVLMLTLVPPATATNGPGPSDATEAAAGSPVTERVDAVPPDEGVPELDVEAPSVAPAIAGDDAAAAVRSLLERRAECFDTLDLDCLDDVTQPGSAIQSADRAAITAARDGDPIPDVGYDLSTARITAEMGDAVLVEVTPAGVEREPASLLVVRGEAGWRLREIFG